MDQNTNSLKSFLTSPRITKILLQNKKARSRLISSKRAKLEEIPPEETTELEPFSAARCQIFKKLNNNKKVAYMKDLDLHVCYNHLSSWF